LLASLFADADDLEKWGGINHPSLDRPEVIRAHERVVKDGEYEKVLRAQIKYDEFEWRVQTSTGLKEEWAEIKRLFPKQIEGQNIIPSLARTGAELGAWSGSKLRIGRGCVSSGLRRFLLEILSLGDERR
jgi:hypothetical protein